MELGLLKLTRVKIIVKNKIQQAQPSWCEKVDKNKNRAISLKPSYL